MMLAFLAGENKPNPIRSKTDLFRVKVSTVLP